MGRNVSGQCQWQPLRDADEDDQKVELVSTSAVRESVAIGGGWHGRAVGGLNEHGLETL